jgi:hypothetical protein
MNAIQKEIAYQASLAREQARWMKLSREDRERAEALVIARKGRKFHIRDVLAVLDCYQPAKDNPCLECEKAGKPTGGRY